MSHDASSTASLISRIHTESAEFLTKRLNEQELRSPDGLSELASSHGYILFCLSKTSRMTMGELAEKINRDKSTTTVLVRKLTKAGFVRIEKCSTDSRCKYLMLTDRGREWNELTARLSKELLKTYYKGFSAKEKETLFSLLNRVSDNLSSSRQKV
jgi:MarR family transcriptional regulator, organic hydroperoxide resistance regulator